MAPNAELVAVGLELARLRYARRPYMSQEDLGRLAGVSREVIGRLERGERKPGDEPVLWRVGEALGLDQWEMARLTDRMKVRELRLAKLSRLIERNPGILTMVTGLDDEATYCREAMRVLARAMAQMCRAQAEAERMEADRAHFRPAEPGLRAAGSE